MAPQMIRASLLPSAPFGLCFAQAISLRSVVRSGYDAFGFSKPPFEPPHVVAHFAVGSAHGLRGHAQDVGDSVEEGFFAVVADEGGGVNPD